MKLPVRQPVARGSTRRSRRGVDLLARALGLILIVVTAAGIYWFVSADRFRLDPSRLRIDGLVYTDEQGSWQKSRDKVRKAMDLSFSVGLSVGREGKVSRVMWDSPAFNAGITNGATLIAINGHAYNDDDFKQAIRDAKGTTKPITLLVRQGDYFRTVSIAWNGGLRYPHLEKIDPKAPSSLDALYTARK